MRFQVWAKVEELKHHEDGRSFLIILCTLVLFVIVDSVSCIFGAGEVREISTNLIEYLNHIFPDEVGSIFGSLNVDAADESEQEEDDVLSEETTEDGNDDKPSNNYTVEEEANHDTNDTNGYDYGTGNDIGGDQENLPDNINTASLPSKKDEGTDLA